MKTLLFALLLSVISLPAPPVQAGPPIVELLQPGQSSTFLLDRFGTNLIVRCSGGEAPPPVSYRCQADCMIGIRLPRRPVEGYFRDRTETVQIHGRLNQMCKEGEVPNSSEREQVRAINVRCE